MLKILERAFLTEAINRLGQTFLSNSDLGIVVLYIGASLDFGVTNLHWKCLILKLPLSRHIHGNFVNLRR